MIKGLGQKTHDITNRALEVFAPVYDKLFYFPGEKSNFISSDIDISNVETISFLNSLGQKISVWRLKAANPIGRVIHCHGSGYNVSSHYPHVSWLAARGYEVIMFDYPGYGDSEGIPTRGSTVLTAVELINSFSESATLLPVFVLGQSLGGNIAAVALSKPNASINISGVILDSMYSSFKVLGAEKLKRKYLKKNHWAAKFIAAFISDSESPLSVAEHLKIPTLIIHSRKDSIVPFQESLNFYERMNNNDAQLWSHLQSDHTEVLQKNIDGFRDKLVVWMARKAKR